MNAEEFAKSCMVGHRDGSNRPSWRHPEDVVTLAKEVPDLLRKEPVEAIAWLHDVLEDGKLPDGERVTPATLKELGFSEEVVSGVGWLTCQGDKKEYLIKLLDAPLEVRLVKCLDRICNLREGFLTFSDSRWQNYVGETLDYIVPLAESLPNPLRIWLANKLLGAIILR